MRTALAAAAGFALLGLQGVSEFIKRLAFLGGQGPDPTQKVQAKTPEEELAEAIRIAAEQAAEKAAAAAKAVRT